ncbi:uncharacterized protein LOC127851091 isoform X2 [Dreissena polymorpha]|uniref:uncharacterized protein LOC127851091 isoform X2 n=1 Tax=Dreissena polymorpha TaxID=45954 RepID=UPI002263CADE|nr:uncharacterized protein LOC127851091 isoform X2 [Dreissena polymorpha]
MPFLEQVGYVMTALTLAAIFVTFVTPYWLVNEETDTRVDVHTGLLVICEKRSCHWIFEDRRVISVYPVWFKATQGLMLAALALGILVLIVATVSICCTCINCTCCSCTCCSCNRPIYWLLVIAGLCIAVALVVFGIKANQEWKIDFQMDISSSGRFGWSFWTAIGAAGGALLTSVIYCCMDRKSS